MAVEDDLACLLARVLYHVARRRTGCALYRTRKPWQRFKYVGGDVVGHVKHGDAWSLWQEQRMARRHRKRIEDGHRVLGLKDFVRGNLAGDYFGEEVCGIVRRQRHGSERQRDAVERTWWQGPRQERSSGVVSG